MAASPAACPVQVEVAAAKGPDHWRGTHASARQHQTNQDARSCHARSRAAAVEGRTQDADVSGGVAAAEDADNLMKNPPLSTSMHTVLASIDSMSCLVQERERERRTDGCRQTRVARLSKCARKHNSHPPSPNGKDPTASGRCQTCLSRGCPCACRESGGHGRPDRWRSHCRQYHIACSFSPSGHSWHSSCCANDV